MVWFATLHTSNLKNSNCSPDYFDQSLSFTIETGDFDVTKKISKDNYSLLVHKKTCLPNNAQKLKCEFIVYLMRH